VSEALTALTPGVRAFVSRETDLIAGALDEAAAAHLAFPPTAALHAVLERIHALQGLGTAMIRMPRFTDPQSFMAALWEADIIARRKSLLYLQSLKLLQTTLDRVLPED